MLNFLNYYQSFDNQYQEKLQNSIPVSQIIKPVIEGPNH